MRGEKIYGKPKCISKAANIKKYFEICRSDDCHERFYVFL